MTTDTRIIREFADRGTLWLLESPESVRQLLRLLNGELADRLDFTQAERINRSLIPEDLQKLEADLIYRVPFREDGREVLVYILLEHQSTIDHFMDLRLLSYMVELWKAQRRDKSRPGNKLAPILPVLFYSGTERWDTPLTLDAVMDMPAALSGFVPRHDTLCLRLRDMPAEALTGSPLAWVLRVLQVEDAPLEELSRILTQAVAHVEENLANDEVEWHRFVLYLLLLIINRRQAAERNDLFDVVRETLKLQHREEVDNMIYSSAQAWFDDGRKEGEQIGQQKGE